MTGFMWKHQPAASSCISHPTFPQFPGKFWGLWTLHHENLLWRWHYPARCFVVLFHCHGISLVCACSQHVGPWLCVLSEAQDTRAASHYALGIIYNIHLDCITLLHPWCNHYTHKKCKSNGHFHACVCPCSGGKESLVSNQHFLVLLRQPISFCILKKRASCSAWFIFLGLICHFLVRHSLAKCFFHSSFICCGHAEVKGWWKRGRLPPAERFKNSYNRFSERTIRQIYLYCEIFTCGTP